MADVYIDRVEGGKIEVKVYRGMSAPKIKLFDERAAAEAFALANMGKRTGMVLSTLDMTPEQLARHRIKQDRIAALMAGQHPDDGKHPSRVEV
jgi:hypothetical protein